MQHFFARYTIVSTLKHTSAIFKSYCLDFFLKFQVIYFNFLPMSAPYLVENLVSADNYLLVCFLKTYNSARSTPHRIPLLNRLASYRSTFVPPECRTSASPTPTPITGRFTISSRRQLFIASLLEDLICRVAVCRSYWKCHGATG